LVMVIHHIVADGWSMSIIFNELAEIGDLEHACPAPKRSTRPRLRHPAEHRKPAPADGLTGRLRRISAGVACSPACGKWMPYLIAASRRP
jgi:hypothetical protein